MWQLHYVSKATAVAAEKSPLGLHMSNVPLNVGCASPQVTNVAFFCDYVQHVLQLDYPTVWKQIQNHRRPGHLHDAEYARPDRRRPGRQLRRAAAPARSTPSHNADTEVLIQPGTGAVRAIAVNRTFGNGPGDDELDYAVNQQYGGSSDGVQTGSSSKIFTLITALKQGMPFGHTIKVKAPATVGPFPTCNGQTAPKRRSYNDAEGPTSGTETWQLGEATVQSINLYFVNLEKQVGLCNVVKTAVDMGMTRADGTSLLKHDVKTLGRNNGAPAYDFSSFTLGSVDVSPMSMAAAYASVAARGIYCSSAGHHEDRRDGHRPAAAGPRLAVPPGHGAGRRRRGQLHPAGRAVLAGHRGGPWHPRPHGGGQDRYRERRLLRCLRRLHPDAGRLRVGVQPGQPDQVRDAGLPESLLPRPGRAVLPGADVR